MNTDEVQMLTKEMAGAICSHANLWPEGTTAACAAIASGASATYDTATHVCVERELFMRLLKSAVAWAEHRGASATYVKAVHDKLLADIAQAKEALKPQEQKP